MSGFDSKKETVCYVAEGIIRQYLRSDNKEGFLDGLQPFLGIIDEGPHMEECLESALCTNGRYLSALKTMVDRWEKQNPATPAGKKNALIHRTASQAVGKAFAGYDDEFFPKQNAMITSFKERWELQCCLYYCKTRSEVEAQAYASLAKKLDKMEYGQIEALSKKAESAQPPQEACTKIPGAPVTRTVHADRTGTPDGRSPRTGRSYHPLKRRWIRDKPGYTPEEPEDE